MHRATINILSFLFMRSLLWQNRFGKRRLFSEITSEQQDIVSIHFHYQNSGEM